MNPLDVGLSGAQLVEASAGTGKTHAITTLFVRLLLERGFPVDGILVVTYTNAATAELRDRIRRTLRKALEACGNPERLSDSEGDLRGLLEGRREQAWIDRAALQVALGDFDDAAIFTIHGFCQRVLQENAFESGTSFDAEILTDESELRSALLQDYWVSTLAGERDELVRFLGERKVKPSELDGLVRKVLGNPDLLYMPPDVVVPDVPDPAERRRVLGEAIRIWEESRDEVEKLLVDAAEGKVLNKKSYPPDKQRERVAELGDVLRGAKLLATDWKYFVNFTSRGLEEKANKGKTPPVHPLFEACDRVFGVERKMAAHLEKSLVRLELELARTSRERALRWKEVENVLSFDDLLVRVRDALSGERGGLLAKRLRERFPAALVDEFQDTDPVQYQVLDRIWSADGEAPLFLIGDPKQAIYAFRGADVHAYLRAKSDVTGDPHEMRTNWRSDPGVLRAVNFLFGRVGRPFLNEQIPYIEVRAAPERENVFGTPDEMRASFRFLFFGGEETKGSSGYVTGDEAKRYLPSAVAGEIVRLLRERLEISEGGSDGRRPLQPGDVAVLCRTNAQAGEIQDALRKLRVPAVLQGDRSVFESREAKEVLHLLEAMADPGDPRLLRAAMATDLLGVRAVDLEALDREEGSRWDEWAECFVQWHEAWTRQGFMWAYRSILDEKEVPARLLSMPGGERRLTNVLHLGELVHRAALSRHRGPSELVDWLRREIDDEGNRGELAPEEMQIRLESDADAVTLTTIHKAKGLEWPVVFCPYLWGETKLLGDDAKHFRFHDDDGNLVLDLGSEERDESERLAKEEAAEEDRRLLYVALTRARHQVNVVWGGFTTAERSSLGKLLGADDVDMKSDEAILRHLRSLAEEAGGPIRVRRLELRGRLSWDPERAGKLDLEKAEFRRGLDDTWRVSSFTALVRKRGAAAETGTGADFDEETVGTDERGEPSHPAGERGEEGRDRREVPLAAFPAGAAAGIVVHEILERLDLSAASPQDVEKLVRSRLGFAGLDANRWTEPLAGAIGDVLATPLGVGGTRFRLRDVPPERRVPEMEFTLPVGPDDGRRRLTVKRLADTFARHRSSEVPERWVRRLRELRFRDLAGYLRGSIDLVFEEDGRFWIVDWKSNRLGTTVRDYGSESVREAMRKHDYYLQYHLYLVALHRHLVRSVPDYDYDRHVGGAFYLFVRGMVPGAPEGSGVFFDRPPVELVEALSEVLT